MRTAQRGDGSSHHRENCHMVYAAGHVSDAPKAWCDSARRHRRSAGHIFSAPEWRGVPPAAHSFLSCQKRMGRKEALGTRNSAVAPEKQFVTFCVLSLNYRRQNALRAAVGSGFPSARHAVQVALFAPVEYLTYGIRSVSNIKRLVGADASVRPTLPQSISTTTPVCQIRICSAFCRSESVSAQTKPPGKIQGRGPQPPFLVVLRGLQKGKAPTRIQRSDSCGKRRNNGTDEACPPQAAGGMRDVEFVPTQIPLCRPFFRPSTALSFPCGKESGVEKPLF